jgi:type I restriction enzyme M protein
MTLNDLKQISDDEMKGKYNQFAEILRTQNVSSKESAFDKLINLFLCKIVDEKQSRATGKELEFYWKGEYFDDYFSLLDRLQKLYKDGMGEFLGEKITYIDNKKITDGFVYFKQDKNATQDYILKLFKEQKYFTNSDFGFIDVHNDKLFYQNAVILLEVIRMWQNYQLTSEQQHQFLGNMFELFLDKGFKQSEGQFFTPIPICKFILQSLPLEKIVKTNSKPPKVIDYACGSGHFLTEYASQIKAFIDSDNSNELKKYYAAIYGVEKEYRLSKVAKISAFMYGQDEINVIYCDALNTIQQEISGKVVLVEDETIDILVANPPFAVDGFLTTLPADKRYDYTLFNDSMDAKTQNNIQCFFIERAMQLLKPNGIAAIIVPSSVLSNSDKTHVGSREILLKFFDIVALVELGSGTFGKTGTNTVVLFLRRKYKQPPESEQYFNRVNDWFSPIKDGDEVYNDRHFIERYCQHIGIPVEQYETLLNGKPSEDLLAHEMFIDYQKQFDLKKHKSFLTYLQTIEKDKLFYFVLAYENPQKVLVIKSPSDNKKQKAFLGYEWSSRKGDEGIKLTTDSNGKHLTPLYDETNRDNPEKINALITQNFLGELAEIPEVLQPFASLVKLVDMLDFSSKEFSKTLSLVHKNKKSVEIKTKYEVVKLTDEIQLITKGTTPTSIGFKFVNEGINFVKIESILKNGNIDKTKFSYISKECNEKLSRSQLKEKDILFSIAGALGRTTIVKSDILPANINQALAIIRLKEDSNLSVNFTYLILQSELIQEQLDGLKVGIAQSNLSLAQINEFRIPLPPLEIQQQIVNEIEELEKNKSELLKEGMTMKDFENVIKEEKSAILRKFLSFKIELNEEG